jgi:hypothetical protein
MSDPTLLSDHLGSDSLATVVNGDSLDSIGWETWLAARREMFQKKYLIDPEQLVADQRREHAISRDYQGREVLELLQNAADAASAASEPGRAHIELNTRGLIVANTGRPFTVGGVKSLQTPDLSPKHSKNSKFIGSKGLGFRSILNWTRHPIILSGELSLAFNIDFVHQLIQSLAEKSSQIGPVRGAEAKQYSFPVPLLPFPMHLSSGANRQFIENAELLARCEQLKALGFQTVIGMPFDRTAAYEHALTQVEVLRPEFLLFAEGLEELAVVVNTPSDDPTRECVNYLQKTWRAEKEPDDRVYITELDHVSGDETQHCWRLYTKTGAIDKAMLQDEDDPESYHLVVAFQSEGLAKPDNLYSFFPTSIPLPVHALCHASLELEQNRKRIQDSAANAYVLECLAEFLAEKIELQGLISSDPHLPRQLIAPESLLHSYQVDIAAFQTAFVAALRKKKILPTISGELVSADVGIVFPRSLKTYDWLPAKWFPNVVFATDHQEQRLCKLLEVAELKGEQFVGLLQASDSLSREQRAAIAQGIIDENLNSSFCYQGLLLDAEGNVLQEDDRVYLPGGSIGEGLVFPEWAKIKILNEPLWKLLRGTRVRESAKKLAIFGVQEYALGALIAGLVSSANATVENHDENRVRGELLASLYKLYSSYDDPDERPSFPTNLNAIVLNKTGVWIPAKSAYFDVGYSSAGAITSALYKAAPEKLIAESRNYLTFGILEEQLFAFLSWLGVAEWPRLVKRNMVEAKFMDYALPKLEYPAIFSESDSYRFNNYGGLPSNCSFKHVLSLDGLDVILSAASSAILAWLAKDHRAAGWLQVDSKNGRLSFVPPGCQNERTYNGELASYIHWKIKTTLWLSSADDKPLAPVDCMVNDAAIAGIFPKPRPPNKSVIENYSITPEMLRLAWLNAGVRSGVEELDSEEIYGLLRELPVRDLDGKLVKKIYNWLIKSVDFPLNEQGVQYLAFIDNGEIYATLDGQQGYFPVKEAYHVDVEGFPQELVRSLPVANLPKKRGAEKVRRLFGINVLDKKAVNETVIGHRLAACTELANQHFQTSKRYIEIYRRSNSAKAVGQPVFERLQLRVCESIQNQIIFHGETLNNQMPAWSYSIQDDHLYICCEPLQASEPYHSLLADTIGEAIAAIFSVNDGDPFSKLYQCDERSRSKLLSKMVGDDLDDDLDAQLQRLKNESADHAIQEPVVTMGPVPMTPEKTVSNPPPPSVPPEVASPSTSSVVKPTGWNVPKAVIAESVEHVTQPPVKPIGTRVGGGGSGAGSNSSNSVVVKSDGRAGEELARLFEESQGRFPLEVWHITGSDTISADILSFRCDEDRVLFKSGEDQRAALVERVIEAKEKWSGGLVKLTDNELKAAAVWKGKYYIYRFKPIDTEASTYELKVLCNPLAHIEAVASSVEISLDRATSSEQFVVRGTTE